MTYIVLALAWAAWATLHSLLLNESVKKFLTEHSPRLACHWRLGYSVLAGVTLAPLAGVTWMLDGPVLWSCPSIWPPLILNLGALLVAYAGIRAFGGLSAFLGLGERLKACDPQKSSRPVQKGILGWIRHPLYASAFVLLWAHDLNASSLVAAVVLSLYLIIGTGLEENRLEKEWGDSWLEYRAQVSAFIPIRKIRNWMGSLRGR